jgi:hypothetical protein
LDTRDAATDRLGRNFWIKDLWVVETPATSLLTLNQLKVPFLPRSPFPAKLADFSLHCVPAGNILGTTRMTQAKLAAWTLPLFLHHPLCPKHQRTTNFIRLYAVVNIMRQNPDPSFVAQHIAAESVCRKLWNPPSTTPVVFAAGCSFRRRTFPTFSG